MAHLELGQKSSIKRKFTNDDITAYRRLTKDKGLGFAETAAEDQEFVPGPLLGGMVSELLGTKLPGPGTNWLKQRYKFLKSAQVGDEITAIIEIIRLRPEKMLVNLKTEITNSTGEVLCQGDSLVLVRDPARFS